MAGAEHGGAEAFFERLVPALGRTGAAQRVLIRRNPGRAQRLRDAGAKDVIELPFGGPFDLATPAAIRRHLAEFAPEILFTWMSRATAKAPARAPGARYAHVARLGGFYDLRRYRRCDFLIGDSPGVMDHIAKSGWPGGRAALLPNFAADVQGRPIARAALGVPEGAPILLALARLHPNKGIDTLLRALAAVPGAHLLIAGEGPERGALESLAAQMGMRERAHFLGWRSDAPDLLASATLLVHPARIEPLGNVILEAWAARLPVVATASSGPAALIRDGVSGRLAPVDDAPALAAAIAAALGDPDSGRRMAQAGRARFEAEFAEAPVVARYHAVLAEAARQCAA